MASAAFGVAVFCGAGYALKDKAREEWYLRRLASKNTEVREHAISQLAALRSRRAIPPLKDLKAWYALFDIAGIGFHDLGFQANQIHLKGRSSSQVVEILGQPDKKLRSGFQGLGSGCPEKMPEFDEQWSYQGNLEHILVFFNQERVVFAVHEWSDW